MVDLVYALLQVVHNLAAAAIVGLAAAGWRLRVAGGPRRRLARWLLAAWGLQIASGAGFALASKTLKGALPEVGGVALAALLVKIGCATLGLLLAGAALTRDDSRPRAALWALQLAAAAIALGAAAFLRWYL